MNEELKHQIMAAVAEYAKEKGVSNNEMARLSGVNGAYISNMMRGNYFTESNGKKSPIADKWFYTLAEWAQITGIQKRYWETVPTIQFTQIIASLESARKNVKAVVLIAPTGSGKTYAIDRYVHRNPMYTYRITVSALHKLPQILGELIERTGVSEAYKSEFRLKNIIDKMKELKRSGITPQIIIDEAENLKLPVLQMLKALYDGVKDYCSIVLIGTQQLIKSMDKMRRKDANGMPQLYRRLKGGIRIIDDRRNFQPFFDKFDIDKGLQRLLINICENYGELNDYLEPALKESDRAGVPLTENFFRVMYNMPNHN